MYVDTLTAIAVLLAVFGIGAVVQFCADALQRRKDEDDG